MKQPSLLPVASLLLVILLCPGFSRAQAANHSGTEAPGNPKEGAPAQEANGSLVSHHQAKRFLPPRTLPYPEAEPIFKIVNCRRSQGYCQEYCNYKETQVGYCSKRKDPCCLRSV